MKRNRNLNEAVSLVLILAVILAFFGGLVALGIWFEIQRWHVYNYTHHTNIGYWTWQFFVNSNHSN